MAEVEARRLGEMFWVVESGSSSLAAGLASWLSGQPGVVEAWPAFECIGVEASCDVESLVAGFSFSGAICGPIREHVIPVLYDVDDQYDLLASCKSLGLDPADLIALHSASTLLVEAIGFSPGFGYLTGLDERLCGLPRLASPRKRVPVGAVALTESFCGIYPSATPGGWNIVGLTPLEMADVASGYFPLKVGDTVRFRAIDQGEFDLLQGGRLGD